MIERSNPCCDHSAADLHCSHQNWLHAGTDAAGTAVAGADAAAAAVADSV